MESGKNIEQYCTNDRSVFFEIAKKYQNLTSKILDIGAGNGDFSKYLKRKDIFLFDGNYETVNVLKKSFPNVKYGHLPDLPYDDSSFDLIHCSHVVEHLSPETLYQTLKEINRCLKKNGYFIVSAPLFSEYFYSDLSHIKPYQPTVFQKYLVWGNSEMTTRPIVSNQYSEIELIYRYDNNTQWHEVIVYNNKFIRFAHFYLKKIIRFIGYRKYSKTGFTLVLQKNIVSEN